MTPSEVLENYFGYKEFRPSQLDIINSINNKENVLAILPTGGGKSICYQVPALMSGSFSIIISPLIALMKDQVDALNSRSKIAAFINSSIDFREANAILSEISSGKIKILYLAPEKLENQAFASTIKDLAPDYLFVDEAHCISEWGHNFRPSYTRIREFSEYINVRNISAFTATATPEVVSDIIKQLGMKNPKIVVRGFRRDNLAVRIIKTNKKNVECIDLLNNYGTPAIVYTSSRKKAEEINQFLNLYKMNSACYHAGLASEERKLIQEKFIQGKIDIICATNAFGMGIDKKDIRLIIHYNMPGSVENYYQEIGRAGRDGAPANAFMLYEDSDQQIHKYFISNSYPEQDLIINVYNALCDYGKVAAGSSCDKEIAIKYDYISSWCRRELSPSMINAAINVLENAGYIKRVSEFQRAYYLQFLIPVDMLREYVKKANDLTRDVIMIILQTYGGTVMNTRTRISVTELAAAYGVSESFIEEELAFLHTIGIAEYSKPGTGSSIKLTGTRSDPKYIQLNYDLVSSGYTRAVSKLNAMTGLVFSDDCRMRTILEYFGEEAGEYRCGKCDNCSEGPEFTSSVSDYLSEIVLKTAASHPEGITLKKLIAHLLGKEEPGSGDTATFGACSNYNQSEIKGIIERLISAGDLKNNSKTGAKLIITGKGLGSIDGKEIEILRKNPVKSDYETDLELFHLLREARNEAARKFQQTGNLICSDEVLRNIADKKPLSSSQLLSVKGVTQRMYNKFGDEIIHITGEFIKRKKAEQNETETPPLPSNISETYSLIKKGHSLKDIASLRKLTEAVISMQTETILEYYPDMDISGLISKENLEIIEREVIKGYQDLRELKGRLPVHIDFSEIRIAAAWLKNKKV